MKDLTKDYDYKKLLDEEKQHYSEIEITDDLREGGAHASAAWNYYWHGVAQVLDANGFSNIPEYFSQKYSHLDRPIEILSLGSGYCGHELSLARGLSHNYNIHCTDINETLFGPAQSAARAEGLHLEFSIEDLNFIDIARGRYDIIFAHAVIHHVINLEHLFSQLKDGLSDGGVLHLIDVVGQNRKLIWDESEKFANALLDLIPHSILQGRRLNVLEDVDGMEGIRQAEITSALHETFEPIFEHRHGAFMRFICTNPDITPCLDPREPEKRRYLDFLIASDVCAVNYGILHPLEIWGLYRPRR